jgi:hypothetical protein
MKKTKRVDPFRFPEMAERAIRSKIDRGSARNYKMAIREPDDDPYFRNHNKLIKREEKLKRYHGLK